MTDSVALVYPYFRTSSSVQHLFHPLGIASLSSQLKAQGITVTQYDCTFRSFEEITNQIIARKPAIVGIYIMATLSKNALRLLRRLRPELTQTLFVAGGPLPTLFPERFAREFDVVFRGESDGSFPGFCLDYLNNRNRNDFSEGLDFADYPGIYLHAASSVIEQPAIHCDQGFIDSLPIPDRIQADHEQYHRIWLDKTGYKPATIMLTRGCPHQCDFCSKPVFGNHFRKRSLKSVFEEVADIRHQGYDQLWIADDSFTLDYSYLNEFCCEMIESRSGLTWTCLSRVDVHDSGIFNLMRRSGCVKVYLGLESGDNETLKLMKKRATVEDGIKAVINFNRAGIKVGAFFIVGYPGETIESIEKTFSLALSLPFDEISFNVPYPLPGSPLFSRLSGLNSDDDWDIENETKFLFESEFDASWLKEKIEETMCEFKKRSDLVVN